MTMKVLSYFAAMAAFAWALTACESDLDKVVYDENRVVPAALSGLETNYVLDKNKGSETILELKWSKPDMGYKASVTNLLEMDLKEKNFANPVILTASKEETTYSSTVSTFNKQIMDLLDKYEMEYVEGEVLDLSFRVGSYISTTVDTIYSEVVNASVTPFVGEAVYPSMVVIGEFCNWTFDKPQFIYSVHADDNYTGMVYFNGTGSQGWNLAPEINSVESEWWGIAGEFESEAADATLEPGGEKISGYSKNSYKVTFNVATGELSMSEGHDNWGVVGISNWNPAESIDMTYAYDDGGANLQCTLEVQNNLTWKIVADKDWGKGEINVNNISYEGDVEDAGADGNFKMSKGTGTYEIKWYFNKVQPVLVVTKK